MSGLATRVFYDTCKQQIGTPSTIYDLGQMTCRTIQKCSAEENPTVSKIQNLILYPARNLLGIHSFQDNLFKLWEDPVLSKGLQAIKNTCDILPIFSAINLIQSTSLEYVPYIKIPINFIQSTHSLYDSIWTVMPLVSFNQVNNTEKKKEAVKNILKQLTVVNQTLQSKNPFAEKCLYKACRELEELIPATGHLIDSKPHESLGILNRMILNSEEVNKNLTTVEIAKLKKILNESINQGCDTQALQNIAEKFKVYLDSVDHAVSAKTLLEVLKAAISWILGASSMLSLFLAGISIPGTALFCLELCSFIVRFAISTYKSYLSNL